MTGFMRIALKVCMGSTVLGSVVGGGYGVMQSGWVSSLQSGGAPSAEQVSAAEADANQSEPADLDAVASAWAQPVPKADDQSAADSSPAARSASVSLARAEEAAVAATSTDRYGIYPSMLTAPAATAETATDAGSEVAVTEVAQAVPTIEASTQAAVARGQEPKDEAGGNDLTSVAVADVIESGAANKQGFSDKELSEPQPLALPAGEADRNITSDRARNAFRDQPVADDRYGASSSPATVNPFAAQDAAAAPATNSSGMIEALPAASPGGDAGAVGQPLNDAYGLPRNRTARATSGGAANQFGGAPQAIPIGAASNADLGGTIAADAGLIGGGLNDSASMGGTGKPGERSLEGPQTPTLVLQKFAPSEIQVGKTAKFVIQVRNAGTQSASDVVVRDEVPQGTRLVSTAPAAQPNGNQLVWQLGKLSAGEERKLEMQLEPLTEGEIGSVATVTYSAQASVKTRCTMPQLAVRMTAPEKVMIGGEQRVKIEISNPGTGDATGVMLFENVPQNVRHAAGPALEFEIGTLRAGETRNLELLLVAEKPGVVDNVLNVRAEGNLQAQSSVKFEIIAPALAVAVNGPERRYLERPATYEVSVENPGTAPAHDVQIITKLPKGLRFVRANNMGEYDSNTHAVYWSLAELPEGESGKVELVAMPIETGQQTLEVESRAGQGLADQAKQQITVEGLAAIMFEVRDLEDPIEVGGETGYEIRVVNQGTKAATNVRVAVNLPPGIQFVSAEGETQYAMQGSALVFAPLTDLAPKADTVFRVRVQGIQAGDQRVTVEVNTDDLGQPIRREESTRVFGDE